MLICKLFSGTDATKVEKEINVFLSKSPQITVHSVCQSADSSRIFISVFFNVITKNAIKEQKPVAQVETIVAKAEIQSI